MADRAKIINIHSKVEGKLPEASVLEYGELAVNYNEKTPKISFKDDKNNIVTISDDNYFIKIIEENEEVTANALINQNNSIKDIEEQVAGARYFTEEKEKTIAAAISEIGEIVTNITYDRLVKLRNNNELIPGKQYRIIDYSTFTGQENTISAGHDFDIIVIADTENTLNENARAVKKENDTYFTEDLSKWELKYSLDNDDKYSWAKKTETKEIKTIVDGQEQTENETIVIDEGKGVIYYMKDANNNECSYDFKNILYDYSVLGSYGYYGDEESDENTEKEQLMVYTFTAKLKNEKDDEVIIDASMLPTCYNNVVKECVFNKKYELNFNVFVAYTDVCCDNYLSSNCKMNTFGSNVYGVKFGTNCNNNVLMNGCHSIIFGNGCGDNTFGNGCYSNTFGNGCGDNTFGNSCRYNTFGNICYNNIFGNYCNSNTFGNICNYNTFGNNYYSNTFGNSCYNNTFGNSCNYNTFGNYCNSNTFGNSCNSNTFGNDCWYNTFGNGCGDNTFGNSCYSNTFGNYCYNNTFGNECYNNTFGNYFNNNTLGEDIQYVDTVDDSASESSSVKYVKILNGTQGTDENKLHITFTKLSGNDKYCQYAGINSKGELKVWCFADMFE